MAKNLEAQSAKSLRNSKTLARKRESRAQKIVTSEYLLRPKIRRKVVGLVQPKRLQKSGKADGARWWTKQKRFSPRTQLDPTMRIAELLNPAPQESTAPRGQSGMRNRQSSMEHCIEVSQPKEQEVRPAVTEGIPSPSRQMAEVSALAAAESGRGRIRRSTYALSKEPLTRPTARRSGLRSRSLVSKQHLSRGSWGYAKRHLRASSSDLTSSWMVSREDDTGSMIEELGPLQQRHRSLEREPPLSETARLSDAPAVSIPASPSSESIQMQLESAQHQELAISDSTCSDLIRENTLSEEQEHTRHLGEASLSSSDSSPLSDIPSSIFDDDIACPQELTPWTEHVTPSVGTEDSIVMPKTMVKPDQEFRQKGQKCKRELESLMADGHLNDFEVSLSLMLSPTLRHTRARYRAAKDQRPLVNDKQNHPTATTGPLMDPTTIPSSLLPPSPSPTLSSTATTTAAQRASMPDVPPLASPRPSASLIVSLRVSPLAWDKLLWRRDQDCTMSVTASTPELEELATHTDCEFFSLLKVTI